MKTFCTFVSMIAILASVPGYSSGDKAQYSLLNRVPESQLRSLSTDRPDVTESPYTVDAGWFQVELDFAVSRIENQNKSTSYLFSNLKVGINNFMDLQLIVDPFHYTGGQQIQNDSQLRLKINLLGNDSGDIGVGLLPFVTFADGTQTEHQKTGGGLAIPVALSLPHDWSLGLMAQWSWDYDTNTNGYRMGYLTSFALGRQIYDKVSGFVEYAASSNEDPANSWAHQMGLGLTYLQTPNQQWDIGIFLGLTPAATDQAPFIGYSVRF